VAAGDVEGDAVEHDAVVERLLERADGEEGRRRLDGSRHGDGRRIHMAHTKRPVTT
jgi:hypothetical protein